MTEGNLRPCFDLTVDKYVFDLANPFNIEKSVQQVVITPNGLVTANIEESSTSSDDDYKEPKHKK